MNDERHAVIVAARRTAVVPKGGAFKGLQADELAAPVLRQLITDAGIRPDQVDQVILGNALYGGGNPARLAALRAGIPQSVPAMTIDTQCCSGLDAILIAARLVASGAAQCVLAGGTESFSRAPIRMHRPAGPGESAIAYARPPFAPAPFEDPDLTDAAARLALERHITRDDQIRYAIASHQAALASASVTKDRLVRPEGVDLDMDPFSRNLTPGTARRAPILSGDAETGLSAATIACEADGAAAVLIVAGREGAGDGFTGLKVLNGASVGHDPSNPALGPIAVAWDLFRNLEMKPEDLESVEIMEAYAPQAMVTAEELGIVPEQLNRMGGALARGHPIGASGAVLAVQLYETLRSGRVSYRGAQKRGMALIAAAGGLASGMAVETV
ncbi:thiolase family protein [Roseibium sp.]|uniref:thiolase family protein n=1 Tax=Roseibium sp. TaxID=1936156 RepID=UPI0039F0236F